MKQYLTKPYVWEVEAFQNADNADKIEILAIKGLADIGEKEEAGWKIQFYGIEG